MIALFANFGRSGEYTLSVFGRDKGYTVNYSPLPEGVPKREARGEGLYLTIYPKLSPNMDSVKMFEPFCV